MTNRPVANPRGLLSGALFTVLLAGASCTHLSADHDHLPAKLTDVAVSSSSPDGKWSLASSKTGDGNPERWFGVIESKSGRPVIAVSDRDPSDSEAIGGTVEATAWSVDSQFVACSLRKGHYVDKLVVAHLSPSGWQSVQLPNLVLEEQYSKLPEVRGHATKQTGGDWIESLKWTSNRNLSIGLSTTLTIDDPNGEPRSYRFSTSADCTFTNSSRTQVRWSGGSLDPEN